MTMETLDTMKRRRRPGIVFILTLGVVLALCNGVIAQEMDREIDPEKSKEKKRAETYAERLKRLVEGEAETGKGGEKRQLSPRDAETEDPMIPDAPKPFLLDPATQQKYLAALQEYYAYRIAGLQHRQRVFKWQLISAKWIFVIVLVLVGAGIYFAAIQFHAGLGRKASGKARETEERTEFVASLKGIKVSSPVLGVIILVISLAFFYLYLVYVYPIEDIF